ncbi:FeoB-associated Cys-rich membrane protein [Eubacterium limosum]|uniref:FeoB-associated Cys-rich membrane protein n=1 Tax=Eubacterium limosum TaxID=1736 RepID=UPI0022E7F2D1|nr:FeoB-associated Cys-rich membrane protein [Eubacterium limosum]
MNLATFIIAAIVFIPMALIIYNQVKKARSGQTGCGCGCSGCSHASQCHPAQETEIKKDRN